MKIRGQHKRPALDNFMDHGDPELVLSARRMCSLSGASQLRRFPFPAPPSQHPCPNAALACPSRRPLLRLTVGPMFPANFSLAPLLPPLGLLRAEAVWGGLRHLVVTGRYCRFVVHDRPVALESAVVVAQDLLCSEAGSGMRRKHAVQDVAS